MSSVTKPIALDETLCRVADALEIITGSGTIIAVQYENLTFPVSKDTHCIYNNSLYKAKQAINDSEDWTPGHWDAATVMGEIVDIRAHSVTDVQVNGTSVVQNGVANVPAALNNGDYGVVKLRNSGGLYYYSDNGTVGIERAVTTSIKNGTNLYLPIVPSEQHTSVFYGLAKAAGDSTQAASDNAVGTYTDDAKSAIRTMLGAYAKPSTGIPAADLASGVIPSVPVQDVQVNGSSILNNGVANLPIASASTLGAVRIDEDYGIAVAANGKIAVIPAMSDEIKAGSTVYRQISAGKQHEAVFYGLAKAAGDSTQASSENAVGTYTDDAKAAIRTMLGAYTKPSTGIPAADLASGVIPSVPVQDVQVDGTSILSSGTAHIPIATQEGSYGLVKLGELAYGLGISATTGDVLIYPATPSVIKAGGTNADATYRAITSRYLPDAVFYGLAKASGDATQTSSDNAVGTYTDDAKAAIRTMLGAYAKPANGIPAADLASGVIPTVPVTDVQVNGTSVLNNGVAGIPVAGSSDYGVVKVDNTLGVKFDDNNKLTISGASQAMIKTGTTAGYAIVPGHQHESVFWGLAKAAGDTTQSSSANAVGTYTAQAKAAIQTMLGVEASISLVETVSGSTPSITGQPNVRYVCGEVAELTITPPANGTIDVIFESGTTPTTLDIPSTVKLPGWFDATSLEAETIYDIMITDGVYGSVMTWES